MVGKVDRATVDFQEFKLGSQKEEGQPPQPVVLAKITVEVA